MPAATDVEPPANATLLALLRHNAQAHAERPALLAPGHAALSHAELLNQVEHARRQLRACGVARASRVALVLPNGADAASAFLSVASCATCTPLNPATPADALRSHLQSLRTEFVVMRHDADAPLRAAAQALGLTVIEISHVADAPAGRFTVIRPVLQLAPKSPRMADAAPDDIALLLHTSGTTGRPKLVPLSQANLVASAHQTAQHLALQPADRCLNVMPLFHIHGLVGVLLAALAGGGSVVCTPGFDDSTFFDEVARFEPSWMSAVPTMHQALLAQGALYRRKAPTHAFRFVRSSSAALPAATLRGLEALFDAPVVEAYGMTEAAHQMASNPVQRGGQWPGSVGPSAGAQITILDAAGHALPAGACGEIAVRGAGVMRGYLDDAEANAAAFHDGWFRTGDLGHLDAQGRLFIEGRQKEIVNRGGEKVMPREVDDALLAHPGVAQACAFGVPHPTLGEDLAAVVVRSVGATPETAVNEAELRSFLVVRLAAFKVPSQIVFAPRIPAGATGKVQRTTLHEALASTLQRPFVAPSNDDERGIDAIMRGVLACGPLGVHDNFFARGGDSLSGARVVARVNRQFGIQLPTTALFWHPSVAALATQVAAERTASGQARDDDAALVAEIDALSDDEVEQALAAAQAGADGVANRIATGASSHTALAAVDVAADNASSAADSSVPAGARPPGANRH
jgi:oxalate---CoA ligase